MKKRIALIANDIANGIAYQRGHLVLKHLRDKYDFHCFDTNQIRHSDMFYLDAAIVFHPYTTEQALLIKRMKGHYGIKVISDFDDLLDKLPVDHPAFVNFKSNSAQQCAMFSDHVTYSTRYLADAWAHLNKNHTVIENTVDTSRYVDVKKNPKPYHSGFVVGWTGSQSHRPDLYNTGFIEGLAMAMRKEEEIRAYFHLLCSQELVNEFGSRIIFNEVTTDYLDYPAMCYTYPMDLCCVPLQDHPFNDAKSDLRLLDMAPFHIPVLASPRAAFRSHIQERRALGATSDTPEGWRDSILFAYRNHQTRLEAASLAHSYVLHSRHSEIASQQFSDLLQVLLP